MSLLFLSSLLSLITAGRSSAAGRTETHGNPSKFQRVKIKKFSFTI